MQRVGRRLDPQDYANLPLPEIDQFGSELLRLPHAADPMRLSVFFSWPNQASWEGLKSVISVMSSWVRACVCMLMHVHMRLHVW